MLDQTRMSGYSQRYEYRIAPPGGRITWAVQRILLFTTAVFVVQLLVHIFEPLAVRGSMPYDAPGLRLLHWFAFDSSRFPWNGLVWQPLTYMFLHGGLLHLFGNMLWLYVFGPEVERVLGTRQFIRFYFITGILAVMATLITAPLLGGGPVIGASGATMGVLIAFAVVNPDRELMLFPIPIRLTARALVLIVIALNIMSALGPGGTSVATHFGGLAVGYAYMKAIPWWRSVRRSQGKGRKSSKDPMDVVGEAVDNIFNYEKEKRRRK
ncbi:MAG: rhomboid family intramembrane serine protease [Candidatus Hydrogenedentes bacterium]|nr:rhomboid family intramembrane serine protease [Candidatus Hydrogenedentota bacterium]